MSEINLTTNSYSESLNAPGPLWCSWCGTRILYAEWLYGIVGHGCSPLNGWVRFIKFKPPLIGDEDNESLIR